jgi:hypothetical protein
MTSPRIIYKDYVKKAREKGKGPISRLQFNEVLEKQRKIISYMLSLGRVQPWIASKLGEDFVLYAAVNGAEITINVWTTFEYNVLMGTKEKSLQL